MRAGHARRGALLIIVTGLAALMLSLALVFLSTMRSDGEHTRSIVRDTQARMMLNAAISYVLETSRLGWGSQETQGWNDIRNHAIGPIPIDRDPEAGSVNQPTNAVWSPALPLRWPAPGSKMRAPMYVWQRAPSAVRAGQPNPIRVGPGLSVQDIPGNDQGIRVAGLHGYNGDHTSVLDIWRAASLDAPDPAPVIDPSTSLAAFRDGDAKPRDNTSNRAWFRIYRETWEDHDGSGDPYYDVVNLNGGRGRDWNGNDVAYAHNASVFLVTCGSGATLGFRDWPDVLASGAASSFLSDPSVFAQLRSEEHILWFRIEWSPNTGDFGPKGSRMNETAPYEGQAIWNTVTAMPSQGGSIRWVQRLDRKPPEW
ncbi:MAG: hypothetical protein H0W72_00830 [Planctomycetes bacterium]|nr:hypothetical protein [Planctomycetota bacterium]